MGKPLRAFPDSEFILPYHILILHAGVGLAGLGCVDIAEGFLNGFERSAGEYYRSALALERREEGFPCGLGCRVVDDVEIVETHAAIDRVGRLEKGCLKATYFIHKPYFERVSSCPHATLRDGIHIGLAQVTPFCHNAGELVVDVLHALLLVGNLVLVECAHSGVHVAVPVGTD